MGGFGMGRGKPTQPPDARGETFRRVSAASEFLLSLSVYARKVLKLFGVQLSFPGCT
jgi:hypothetical protein